MQGTIDIIARGIPQHGSMGLIKSPMGNQSKIQTRGGIGIVLIGTRNMLVPVEKSILILISIPENKIDSTQIAIDIEAIKSPSRCIPIEIMFPRGSRRWISITESIDEYLKIIGCKLGYLNFKRAIAIGQDLLGDHSIILIQCPDNRGSLHDAIIGDSSRYLRIDIVLVVINNTVGHPTGNSSCFRKFTNGCLLSEFALALVGKSIPIRIITRPEAQAAKLIHFEPVHHPIGIGILGTRNIVGGKYSVGCNHRRDLTLRYTRGTKLANTVNRPVSKVGTIGGAI